MGGKNNQGNQGNQGGAGGNLGLYGGNQNQTQQNVGGMKNNGAGQQYSQQQAPQYQGRPNFQNLYNEYVSNAPQRFDPRDDTGFFQGGASGPSPFLLEGRQSPSRPVGRQAPGYMGGNPYGNDTPTRPIRPIPTRPEVGTGNPYMDNPNLAPNPYMMPPRPNSPWTPTRPVFNPVGDIFPGYEQGGPNNPRPQPGKPMYPGRPTPRPQPGKPMYPGGATPTGTGGWRPPRPIPTRPDMFTGGSPTFDESAPIGATQPWQPGGDSLTMDAYDAANSSAPTEPFNYQNMNTENKATWNAAVTKEQYRKAFQAAGYSESQIAALEAANNPAPVLYE
tara:strand:- start:1191 stop:2189 length:999 start_codon:yes stop_codon:yes gene_type:complete